MKIACLEERDKLLGGFLALLKSFLFLSYLCSWTLLNQMLGSVLCSAVETELARLQKKLQATLEDFKDVVDYFQYTGEGEEVMSSFARRGIGNELESNWTLSWYQTSCYISSELFHYAYMTEDISQFVTALTETESVQTLHCTYFSYSGTCQQRSRLKNVSLNVQSVLRIYQMFGLGYSTKVFWYLGKLLGSIQELLEGKTEL